MKNKRQKLIIYFDIHYEFRKELKYIKLNIIIITFLR